MGADDEAPSLEAQLGELMLKTMDMLGENDVTKIHLAGVAVLCESDDAPMNILTRTTSQAARPCCHLWQQALDLELDQLVRIASKQVIALRAQVEELGEETAA